MEVMDGIYWGGDFDVVLDLLRSKTIGMDDIRFFLGYSGWSDGQLENELKEKSWITREATRPLVFNLNTHEIWKEALGDLGGEYRQMVNYPIDPQLN
jgi:putative transcriptional regulator